MDCPVCQLIYYPSPDWNITTTSQPAVNFYADIHSDDFSDHLPFWKRFSLIEIFTTSHHLVQSCPSQDQL